MGVRSPLMGYNHNIRHLGWLFHVQTEDSGVASPRIVTHLFHDGVIVATKKVTYDPSSDDDFVRELMQAQHKAVLRELRGSRHDGKIREYLGERALETPDEERVPDDAAFLENSVPPGKIAPYSEARALVEKAELEWNPDYLRKPPLPDQLRAIHVGTDDGHGGDDGSAYILRGRVVEHVERDASPPLAVRIVRAVAVARAPDPPPSALHLFVSCPLKTDLLRAWFPDPRLGGMFVETDQDLAPGALVSVRVEFTGAPARFDVKAVVAWRQPAAENCPAGVGVLFHEDTREARSSLLRHARGWDDDGRAVDATARVKWRIGSGVRVDAPAQLAEYAVFVMTESPPPVGQQVSVTVRAPRSLRGFEVAGSVFLRRDRGDPGMGVRLKFKGDAQRRRLGDVIDELAGRAT